MYNECILQPRRKTFSTNIIHNDMQFVVCLVRTADVGIMAIVASDIELIIVRFIVMLMSTVVDFDGRGVNSDNVST